MAKFLDGEARAAFKRAVETVENASAVEVVVAVRQRSASYRHANVAIAAVLAFVGLATMLYVEEDFHLSSILIDPFVVALVGGALVEFVPQLKRYLTPAAIRRREVTRAARATFVERGVHNTTGRSGVLVYISWLERQVALVADSGLAQTLPAGTLARAENELTAEVRRGGAAVAKKLESLADEMARAMPHQDDDVNELPDAIDEGDEGA